MNFKNKLMKSQFLKILTLAIVFASCSSDDENLIIDENEIIETPFVGDSKVYSLMSVSNSSISGTATFRMNEDNSTTIELEINGASNVAHPAHIHFNTAAEGGDIAISLTDVDGASGRSTTTFSALDDGTGITYDELLLFNGYINVHESADDLGTVISQGDIGQNELTGTEESYALGNFEGYEGDATGTVIFKKRANGFSLIDMKIEGAQAGFMHPSHVHLNAAAATGDIAISLTPVNGDTGISKTSVFQLDNGSPLFYDELINFDGYVNVHISGEDLSIMTQGDIGQNKLTGISKNYTLDSVDDSPIFGTATFFERTNGFSLLVVQLNGTVSGDNHPSHIHFGSINTPGDIAISLDAVKGETGLSKTNISKLDSGDTVFYIDILDFNGYINIHLSAIDLSTIVAQGNIGSNVNE